MKLRLLFPLIVWFLAPLHYLSAATSTNNQGNTFYIIKGVIAGTATDSNNVPRGDGTWVVHERGPR